MLIIPAIDIKEKKVVRLTKGDFMDLDVYSDDPVGVALKWQDAGARLMHVVDLDGAKKGSLENLDVVEKIVKKINVPVELGGGIRDEETIKKILDIGVNFVVLGTKALDDKFLKKAIKRFGEKIIVSIDSKEGLVAVKGWQESSDVDAVKFAKDLGGMGLRRLIYTDIMRDGTLKGPNFFNIEKILDAVNIEIIVSGGISSIEDLRRLKTYENKGLKGAIVGKALYTNNIDLKKAIEELC